MEIKVFSIEEASRLLSELELILLELREEHLFLSVIIGEMKRERAGSGTGQCQGDYVDTLNRISKHVDRIGRMGVLLRDGERGLCDFPSLLNGRLVYLCWKLGEPKIEWWHEQGDGYASRRTIDEWYLTRMGGD